MKKDDLKTGMRVELVNGDQYIVMLGCTTTHGSRSILINSNEGRMDLEDYNDDLTFKDDSYSIEKVYRNDFYNTVLMLRNWNLLWKRKKIKQVDFKEACLAIRSGLKVRDYKGCIHHPDCLSCDFSDFNNTPCTKGCKQFNIFALSKDQINNQWEVL